MENGCILTMPPSGAGRVGTLAKCPFAPQTPYIRIIRQ